MQGIVFPLKDQVTQHHKIYHSKINQLSSAYIILEKAGMSWFQIDVDYGSSPELLDLALRKSRFSFTANVKTTIAISV